MMKLTLFALSTALLLAGCSAAFWGNLVVLGITVGIFVGTLATRSGGSPTQTG